MLSVSVSEVAIGSLSCLPPAPSLKGGGEGGRYAPPCHRCRYLAQATVLPLSSPSLQGGGQGVGMSASTGAITVPSPRRARWIGSATRASAKTTLPTPPRSASKAERTFFFIRPCAIVSASASVSPA